LAPTGEVVRSGGWQPKKPPSLRLDEPMASEKLSGSNLSEKEILI
jgi:hypothetical protein